MITGSGTRTDATLTGRPAADDPQSPLWAVSVCFWLLLTTAAALFGAVALAPKYAVWADVRDEYRRNSRQLVQLEEEIDYLERVDAALASDPEFLQRLYEASGGAPPDGEFIPVSGDLLFGHDGTASPVEEASSEMSQRSTVVLLLAADRQTRAVVLTVAAFMTIFAFAFLNDAGTDLVSSAGRTAGMLLLLPVSRYRAPHTAEEQETSERKEVSDNPQAS